MNTPALTLALGTYTIDAEHAATAHARLAPGQYMVLTAINGADAGRNLIEVITREPDSVDPDHDTTTLAVWFGKDMVGIDVNDGSDITVEVMGR